LWYDVGVTKLHITGEVMLNATEANPTTLEVIVASVTKTTNHLGLYTMYVVDNLGRAWEVSAETPAAKHSVITIPVKGNGPDFVGEGFAHALRLTDCTPTRLEALWKNAFLGNIASSLCPSLDLCTK
jgi:hypothetical protein